MGNPHRMFCVHLFYVRPNFLSRRLESTVEVIYQKGHIISSHRRLFVIAISLSQAFYMCHYIFTTPRKIIQNNREPAIVRVSTVR